jgi:hypothetical protein
LTNPAEFGNGVGFTQVAKDIGPLEGYDMTLHGAEVVKLGLFSVNAVFVKAVLVNAPFPPLRLPLVAGLAAERMDKLQLLPASGIPDRIAEKPLCFFFQFSYPTFLMFLRALANQSFNCRCVIPA